MSKEKSINLSREVFDKNWEELNKKAEELLGNSYKVISLMTIESEFNNLLGDILTIIDVGYGEMPKTKFCKDLVKKALWNQIAKIHQVHYSKVSWETDGINSLPVS